MTKEALAEESMHILATDASSRWRDERKADELKARRERERR